MPTRMMVTSPIFGLRREIDRLFEDAFGGSGGEMGRGGAGASRTNALIPAVDVREDEGALVLEFEMPGISPDDVQITADNGVLTVRAEKRDERARRENERHHIVERSYGTYVRSIQLPQGVDDERIEADFEHGVLRVHVPKAAQPQPRRIQVRTGGAGGSGGREVSAGSSHSGSASVTGGSRGGTSTAGDPMQSVMNSTGSAGMSGGDAPGMGQSAGQGASGSSAQGGAQSGSKRGSPASGSGGAPQR